MTRQEAAQKIAKLRRLAERAGTPAEAENARGAMEKLMKQFGLTDAELAIGRRAAAFDDLLEDLNRFVGRHDVPQPVFMVIEHFKKNVAEGEKSDALSKIVTGVRAASFFFGGDPTVKKLKASIDEVLTKHQVTV